MILSRVPDVIVPGSRQMSPRYHHPLPWFLTESPLACQECSRDSSSPFLAPEGRRKGQDSARCSQVLRDCVPVVPNPSCGPFWLWDRDQLHELQWQLSALEQKKKTIAKSHPTHWSNFHQILVPRIKALSMNKAFIWKRRSRRSFKALMEKENSNAYNAQTEKKLWIRWYKINNRTFS